jgi:hypothetical protein
MYELCMMYVLMGVEGRYAWLKLSVMDKQFKPALPSPLIHKAYKIVHKPYGNHTEIIQKSYIDHAEIIQFTVGVCMISV